MGLRNYLWGIFSENEEANPLCHENCWHYGNFGGVEGCEQVHGGWGGWPEPIEPGEECLYPEKRDVFEESFSMSTQGFCAALAGEIIEGRSHDNARLVKLLTSEYVEQKSKLRRIVSVVKLMLNRKVYK